MAKFSNKSRAFALVLLVSGGMAAAVNSSGESQKGPPLPRQGVPTETAVQKGALPVASGARLARLDALRAQLEEAKLVRDIAKVKAEARDAGTPSVMTGPSMPVNMAGLPPVTSLEVPPAPPRGGAGSPMVSPGRPPSQSISVIEAWGSGTRQARVSVNGSERLVRVGDKIGSSTVSEISNGTVTLADAKGRKKRAN